LLGGTFGGLGIPLLDLGASLGFALLLLGGRSGLGFGPL
jgi:hypothetical protein